MRNLTNARVRALGKKDLRRVFRVCKFRDALTLDEGDVPVPDDFIYYYNKARDLPAGRQGGTVGNYVVYETVSTDPARRADDVVIGREFYAQVDVFSVKSFESKFLQDALARLEEKLTTAGFDVYAHGEDYEPDTRLYHQILYVSKLFF